MEPIWLSSLGRQVHVGNLYDYYSDRILTSSVMVPDSSIHVEKSLNMKTECTYMFHQHEPNNLKHYVLGINSHLSKNIKQGNVDGHQLWCAEYLETLKAERDEHVVKIDVRFRVVRQIATLDHHFLQEKWQDYQLNRSGWTHVVEQVVYGAEFICSIWKPVDLKVETRECPEGSLYLAAKTYFDDAIGSHWSTSKELPAELKNASCVIYNSLDSEVLKGTFQRSYTWLREAIIREDQAWRPQEILLRYVPENLEILRQHETLRDQQLENVKTFFRWNWIKEQSRILSAHPLLKRAPIFSRPLERLYHLLEPLQNASKKYTETNSPQEANISISNLVTKVTEWLMVIRKQIETIVALLSNDSRLFVLEWDDIMSWDDGQKQTKVFVLKVNYVDDNLISTIIMLTKLPQPGEAKLPDFPIFSAGKKSLCRIGKQLHGFTEEAKQASLIQSTKYCIGLLSDPLVTDGTIRTIAYSGKANNRQIVFSDQHPELNNKERPTVSSDGFEQKKKVGAITMDHVGPSHCFQDRQSCVGQQRQTEQDQSVEMEDVQYQVSVKDRIREYSTAGEKSDEKENHVGHSTEDARRQQTSSPFRKDSVKQPKQEPESPVQIVCINRRKDQRVAEFFAQEYSQYSQLMKQGQPNVYMLNAKEMSTDVDLRSFDIGLPDGALPTYGIQNHKVVILMGATGCGKSTLINGMVNYILGVQWKDPFRFKCVREEESTSRNQAHSQTSSVTAYTIHHQEGMAVPYSITIIDTPGYGDTRGVARDKEITQKIHRFLMQEESQVDQIHAACFVGASGDSRLTTTQRYILDSVLSIFGKDVKENIRLLVTFADNADPPVVEACRAAGFPETRPSAGIVYSKFNSSVLYACNEQQGEDDFGFDELFWDMGQENFTKFFNMLEGMDGRDLTSTRQVIQCRKNLELSLISIENELESCLVNIENMEIFQRKMREFGNKMANTKDFTIEKTVVRVVKIPCENGTWAYNCQQCQKTCKANVSDYNFDRIRNAKKQCDRLFCPCPGSAHEFEKFQWRSISEKHKTTLLDMKAEFESNFKGKQSNEQLLANCADQLNVTKTKVISLLEQVGSNVRSLESTALRSNSFSPADYLSLIKSRVAEEQKPGYMIRLETLSELQQILEEKQQIAKQELKTPQGNKGFGRGTTRSPVHANDSKMPGGRQPAGGSDACHYPPSPNVNAFDNQRETWQYGASGWPQKKTLVIGPNGPPSYANNLSGGPFSSGSVTQHQDVKEMHHKSKHWY